jgi:DNA modification methylase
VIAKADCRDALPKMPSASVDAVITDPPYELKRAKRAAGGFMGYTWDSDSGAFEPETWAEVGRVAKPGAWVAAFGGRRTWHRLSCAIEDAGLIIRDTFLWAYSTGNVTAPHTTVKPVFEPIVIAQVPVKGSIERAVAEHGTGYLNIDESRIPYVDDADLAKTMAKNPGRSDTFTSGVYGTDRPQQKVNPDGRHPSGLIFDSSLAIDDLLGDFQRFVVVPKASRKERDAGLGQPYSDMVRNPHPSVKPVAIMEWLIGLLCPAGGTVLDPYLGSGTTGVAAINRGRDFVGVERDEIFSEVARLRIEHAEREAIIA